MPRPNTPGFGFIAGPIQTLFKDQQGRLTAMLKVLSVLAIRFRGKYIHARDMDWKTPFDTSIPLLEDCLTSTSATDLARSMSGLDELHFAEMSQQMLVAGDAVVGNLLTHWQTLSISVRECCAALPELVPFLQDCAQVSSRIVLKSRRDLELSQHSNQTNRSFLQDVIIILSRPSSTAFGTIPLQLYVLAIQVPPRATRSPSRL